MPSSTPRPCRALPAVAAAPDLTSAERATPPIRSWFTLTAGWVVRPLRAFRSAGHRPGRRSQRARRLAAIAVLTAPVVGAAAPAVAGTPARTGTLGRGVAVTAKGDSSAASPASVRAKRAEKKGHRVRARGDGGAFVPFATGSAKLVDGGHYKWFANTNITFSTSSSASAAMSEASATQAVPASTLNGGTVHSTLNDAFDGYNTLCVDLSGAGNICQPSPNFVIYNKLGPLGGSECGGRQLVYPVQSVPAKGVTIQRKVYVSPTEPFARWSNIVTNTGATPTTITLSTGNNLGSDSSTRVFATSTGGAPSTADRWIGTFQNYSGATTSDPRIGHVLQGAGAGGTLTRVNFVDGDDNPFWAYTITLAPGQTKVLLNYTTLASSKAAATAEAEALSHFPASAQACLSPAELGAVANFVPPVTTVSVGSATGVEQPGGVVEFPVTITNPLTPTVDVALNVGALPMDTAKVGTDVAYTLPIHHVWHQGEPLSFTIPVPLVDDHVWEADETFSVFLTADNAMPAGGATGTITDAPDRPSVSVSGGSASEGGGSLPFTLTLSNPADIPVSVVVDTHDGTATAPADYTAVVGKTVTFPAGATSLTVPVAVVADGIAEGAETLSLTAAPAPAGPTVTVGGSAVGTITDPVAAATWSVTGGSVTEPVSSTTPLTFTVSLSALAGPGGATVAWATHNGSAHAPADFVAASGVVTLAPGQQTATFTVRAKADRRRSEGTETFTVQLSAPSAGTTIGVGTAVGTILNRS